MVQLGKGRATRSTPIRREVIGMRIKIYKMEDGTRQVLLKRTRSTEGPSVLLKGVKGELPREAVEQAIKAVRREGEFSEHPF